ncbi:MAG: 3-isopropylmalate dehydratase small subunit [Spirochaetales bacterium]|nr:3-isopropylmalate dehydratase small subunit [Spirochaetales bacterium]
MKEFNGKILFLDRNDINTDEIIPAKYLTEISKEALRPYLLEDLKMDGFDAAKDLPGKTVIVTRENFGCGSSREHAPWALEVNDIHIVIAENFARIFRQNMFNCGMMAVPLEKEQIDLLFGTFAGKETILTTDFKGSKFTFSSGSDSIELSFGISDFDRSLVEAGGWVDFADKNY